MALDPLDYLKTKKKGRGRPKGSKNKNTKKVYEFNQSNAEIDSLRGDVSELRDQISHLTSLLSVADQKITNKIETVCDTNELDDIVKKGHILNATERDRTERQIRDLGKRLQSKEQYLNRAKEDTDGSSGVYQRSDNQAIVKEKLFKAKRSLEQGYVGRLSDKDTNRLVGRAEAIEKELRDVFPSFSELNSSDEATTNRLAHVWINIEKKYGNNMRELQNIRKVLNPQNPEAGRLRDLYKD